MVQFIQEKTTASLASLVRDYASYNAWANATTVEWLKTKPTEALEQVVPSSFPSVKETLVHIWDTQRIWFAVIQQLPPPPSFRLNGFDGSVEEVFTELVNHSEQIAAYVDMLSDEDLTEKIHLKTPWFEAN